MQVSVRTTQTVAPAPTSTAPARRGRGRGLHRKGAGARQNPGAKRSLPEYLLPHEVENLVYLAPHGACRLLMLIQWRAGLRISEALDLEARDVDLDVDNPTVRVRRGKGQHARVVPVHPELAAALRVRLDYGGASSRLTAETKLIGVGRQQGSRWIASTVKRAVVTGALAPGRRVTSHTLRHSYARHLLTHGIPLNVLSRWLGHRSLDTTLIYLELLPDPTGSLAAIP